MIHRRIDYEIVVGRERAAKKIMGRTTVGGRRKQNGDEIRVQLERTALKRLDAMRVRWMRDSGREGGRRKGRASQRIQRDNCRGLIGGDALTMTKVECSTVPMWSVCPSWWCDACSIV